MGSGLPRSDRRALRSQPLVRPPTLVARVTEHARRCIVEGEWRLGEYISEDRIAASLGVSRTPVREALTALQMQGLVNIQPQRGTFVFLPTESEVVALCEYRMLMECKAMSLAIARDKDKTLAALIEANQGMKDAAAAGDRLGYGKYDAAFHNALFNHCGNQYFAESYALMSARFDALRNFLSGGLSSHTPSPADEHDQIIGALRAGDVGRAESLLTTHVLKMSDRFAAAMIQQKFER